MLTSVERSGRGAPVLFEGSGRSLTSVAPPPEPPRRCAPRPTHQAVLERGHELGQARIVGSGLGWSPVLKPPGASRRASEVRQEPHGDPRSRRGWGRGTRLLAAPGSGVVASLRACGAHRQVPIRSCLLVKGGQWPPFHTFPPVGRAANKFAAFVFARSGHRHPLWNATLSPRSVGPEPRPIDGIGRRMPFPPGQAGSEQSSLPSVLVVQRRLRGGRNTPPLRVVAPAPGCPHLAARGCPEPPGKFKGRRMLSPLRAGICGWPVDRTSEAGFECLYVLPFQSCARRVGKSCIRVHDTGLARRAPRGPGGVAPRCGWA